VQHRDPIHLARLQPIAAQFDRARQRRLWREVRTATDALLVEAPVRH
jgi:hypothetical protein